MLFLHNSSPPIVHRDLKSSNLLVDQSWVVKVGVSRSLLGVMAVYDVVIAPVL